MKKVFATLVTAGFIALVACGPSADEKAAADSQATQDSIQAAEQATAAQEQAAMQDSANMMESAQPATADTTAPQAQ